MTEQGQATDDRTVLMWGGMGAGKTSLLTTGLLGAQSQGPDRLGKHVHSSCWRDIRLQLHEHYERLYRGKVMSPTPGTPPPVPVRLNSGKRILFQDVVGEHVGLPAERIHEALSHASAILFVLTWKSPVRTTQFEGMRAALGDLRGRPCGVAFTKCERGLPEDHPDWAEGARILNGQASSGWWKTAAKWHRDEEYTLNLAADAGPIWPTSAYGFHEGRPACVLDEFGSEIPYSISPINVMEVVEWYLKALDK